MGIFDNFVLDNSVNLVKSQLLKNVSDKEKYEISNNPEKFLSKPQNEMKFNLVVKKLVSGVKLEVEDLENGYIGIKGDVTKLPNTLSSVANEMGLNLPKFATDMICKLIIGKNNGVGGALLPPELNEKTINEINGINPYIKGLVSKNIKVSNFYYKKIISQIKKKAK